MNSDNKIDKNEIKEDFCPACVAIPLAIAGVGYGTNKCANSKNNYKMQQKILLWTGVIMIISIIIIIYFSIYKGKDCKECSIFSDEN